MSLLVKHIRRIIKFDKLIKIYTKNTIKRNGGMEIDKN